MPDRNAFVVVYCSDSGCGTSSRAAREMERLGYAHGHHDPGGRADWREARLPIES